MITAAFNNRLDTRPEISPVWFSSKLVAAACQPERSARMNEKGRHETEEIAIEQKEDAAIKWLQEQTKEVGHGVGRGVNPMEVVYEND